HLGEGFLVLGMFGLTVFGWLLFRVESLGDVGEFVGGVLFGSGSVALPFAPGAVYGALFACLGIQALTWVSLDRRRGSERALAPFERLLEISPRLGWVAGAGTAALFLAALLLRASDQSGAFIYFQF